MTPEQRYFRACSQQGLILDTNLLILLMVGRYKVAYIQSCPRTSDYTANDFGFIENLLGFTKAKIVVTPHILAEVSNLTFDKMLYGNELWTYITKVLETAKDANEHHTHKDTLIANDLVKRLGFTDLSVIEAASNRGYAVLTEDGDLFSSLLAANCQAMNLESGRILALEAI